MIRKLAVMGLILAVGTLAAKADYPDKPVKIVVPVAAGVDVMARLLEDVERWSPVAKVAATEEKK
jgi:tripartite-type tricarboxylate transporter receptor subunit TctC